MKKLMCFKFRFKRPAGMVFKNFGFPGETASCADKENEVSPVCESAFDARSLEAILKPDKPHIFMRGDYTRYEAGKKPHHVMRAEWGRAQERSPEGVVRKIRSGFESATATNYSGKNGFMVVPRVDRSKWNDQDWQRLEELTAGGNGPVT